MDEMENIKEELKSEAKGFKEDVKSELSESGAQNDIEQLKADLARLRDDMSQLVNSVVGLGKRRATTAKDKAQESLEDTYSAMREGTSRAADSLADTMTDRPLTSIAVAFGIGVLMGKIMGK